MTPVERKEAFDKIREPDTGFREGNAKQHKEKEAAGYAIAEHVVILLERIANKRGWQED
jgi:hypothetical protein